MELGDCSLADMADRHKFVEFLQQIPDTVRDIAASRIKDCQSGILSAMHPAGEVERSP